MKTYPAWEEKKLSELFKIETGTTPSTRIAAYWDGGRVNWITPTDLSHNEGGIYITESERKVTQKAVDESNLTLLPKNSLIISTRAPVGYVAVLQGEAVFNQGCKGLVAKIELSPEFYYYCLISKKTLLNNRSSGSTFKELAKDILEKVELPAPSLPEQKRIVEILSAVDERIDAVNQKIEKIEKLRKELATRLLTGSVNHQETKKAGNIPKGWAVLTLGEVCSINTETIDPVREYAKNKFLYVDIDSVENGTGLIRNPKETVGSDAPSRARRVIRHKDVIMSTVRPYLKAFALVPAEYNGCVCSTGFAVLRCGEKIIPTFLLHSLFSKAVIDQCNKMMTGGQYPALNSSQVSEITLILPPILEQQKMSQVLSIMDARLENEKIKRVKLENIKKSLMNDLLSGKNRVGVLK